MFRGIVELRPLLDLSNRELPRPRQAGQRPPIVGLVLQLALQQPDQTLGLRRVLLVSVWLVRLDERLQGLRLRRDNLRLLHQVHRLLHPLPRRSDHDVGKR